MSYLNQNAQEEKAPAVKTAGIVGMNVSSLLIVGAILYWVMKK